MFNIHTKSVQFGEKTITLETGRVARQANGAVMVTYGDTVVLVTAVAETSMRAGQDFFPLSVHYQEKFWAAGKIPGGFIKRETRPSEREVLTSRLIDRPIRPLFPKGFMNETQVVAQVLSYDPDYPSDIAALIGCSAALALSGVPFEGPIGGARVGFIDGKPVLNPTVDQLAASRLDLVVAGTRSAVTMVESEVDFLSEDEMLDCVMFAHESFQPVITAIEELVAEAGKPRWVVEPVQVNEALLAEMNDKFAAQVTEAYAIPEKMARYEAVAQVKAAAMEALGTIEVDGQSVKRSEEVASLFKKIESRTLRQNVLQGKRVDGRGLTDIRPIACEVSILPRVHGTALFTRGETQAIATVTLGTSRDEQIVETLSGEYRDRFYLNYTFPPYCVGETGRMGAPGRREIGHGKLATRALTAIVPSAEVFPYTLRITSEITESNGSSSMATVCGAVLAMQDAGVPIKAPVAGIAMGLVKEGDAYAVLSDILGDEDHLGDMDFKVAGNADGITALQMDIKITGITREIMAKALEQARAGRLHILGEMGKAMTTHRAEMSAYAPRIHTMKIHPDKIREVIGSGGKVIRSITEETGCAIDIEDDGTIRIASSDQASAEQAVKIIKSIVAEVEKGQVYEGKVVRITDFGAFVNILPNKDGLVHISQLANRRVQNVTDVVKEGDVVTVKVLDVDRQGRVKLTMKEMEEGAAE
ncbi:Polyribonucleotide nucleotidyltransferase [Magnetococcus marinus MC-1]|uniref:Polyribonucleotide nucleotidyltransferase n=1 Tax=Magnetococcus marinus (strain ATCC BAA-1437 / JCM 17883 / MC-1) TaxID=156889 RepID=PNP_MAGMM|nr:polyribonucleotide nucleotidyltransferase [Magnetococcus marinus]A0LE14.1 RecName: Full=Polyribonucleotide nucleotidyltransferase; AltName: Full=Polynucleotide phosphorylase; Short=PNPase [Magnetococcus marinus MC-1]ABK46207.1 Polyribonucleotide nucleotidyltransferase [Magnetococcus marinus MC-1]